MKKDCNKGTVIKNIPLNNNTWEMTIRLKESVPKDLRAGQVIFLNPNKNDNDENINTVLRRPFSFCEVLGENIITVVYIVIGKGTRMLTDYKEGDNIRYNAFFGNGFQVKANNNRVAIVAGGVGITPTLFLTQQIKQANSENIVDIFYGTSCKENIVLKERLELIADSLNIATDDGSYGYKGFVTDLFKQQISRYNQVYTIGPEVMMKKVVAVSIDAGIPIDISTERFMACGVGACLSCIINYKAEGGGIEKIRTCIEGPILDGYKVVFD